MAKTLHMEVHGARYGEPENGYLPVVLDTSRGEVHLRWYGTEQARQAALFVGGVGGGWDSPACDMYPRLCEALAAEGRAGLRVRFRHPTDLGEAALDVGAGLSFLRHVGIERAGLVGHSFGGAVVIQAAASNPMVDRIVTVATQSYGADPIARLGPRCAVLFIHGTRDPVLPAACSEMLYKCAQEPKELVLIPGGDHCMNAEESEVYSATLDWLRR